jgi:FAD:protein FMN transferase
MAMSAESAVLFNPVHRPAAQETAPQITLDRVRSTWRGRFTAMANPCEVLCETDNLEQAREVVGMAAREASRIERKFSRYRTDSAVHAINAAQGQPQRLDTETADLIDYAATLWQLSDGAFDITSGVLRRVWRFGDPHFVPATDALRDLLNQIGWQRALWRRPTLTLPAGMEVDLGGIGKEYAVDRTVAMIDTAHFMAASSFAPMPVLVNFGGDLRTAGPPPRAGAWQVGIESVQGTGASNLIELRAGALATSGVTHRYVEMNGKRYGHILDARTGWPVEAAPRSVTVAADTCSQAGTFSTLAMLQGKDAEAFLQAEDVRFWCCR